MFEDPELELKGSSLWVYLVVANQGCCRSSQYILLDSMLWLDANTTLNQIYVLFITFVSMTYQSGDQYLPSIHSWDIGPWYVLYTPFFFFRSLFLSFSHIVPVIFNKNNFMRFQLTNFLLKSRFLSIAFITSSFILIIIPSVIKILIMIIITISNIVFRFTVIFRTSIVCCVFLYCLDLTVKVSNLLCLLVCLFVLFLELKSFDKDLQPHYFFLVSEKVKVLLIFYEYLFLVLLFVVAINFITHFSLTGFMAIRSE